MASDALRNFLTSSTSPSAITVANRSAASSDNVNTTTLDGCTNDGHPTSCPYYETGPGTLAISLAGNYDRTTGKGNGSFTVAVARPTSGTWSVG